MLSVIPWVAVASWLIANLIPYIAALATKAPSWATGAIVAGLSVADSFLSDLVANGVEHFDWKLAAVNSFVTWAIAALHHAKLLKGTEHERVLHQSFGNKPAVAA